MPDSVKLDLDVDKFVGKYATNEVFSEWEQFHPVQVV